MSDEKFTQGEWRAEITRVRFPNGKMMWVEGGDFDTQIANAHLIAAAPKMYRILKKQCVLCQLKDHETECDICVINTVLKKARGDE